MYSNSIDDKDTYAHEMGHMLGLPHFFYTNKEKEAYKNARESILGNGLPEKNADGTDNESYRAGIKKNIDNVKKSDSTYYSFTGLNAIKFDMLERAKKHNSHRLAYIEKQKATKKEVEIRYVNYKSTDLITFSDNSKMSKKEYLESFDKNIAKGKNAIFQNEKAINELEKRHGNNYERLDLKIFFITSDLAIILKQNLEYANNVINQVHYNYLFFKQNTTKNIMDYYNNRHVYSNSQIKIMRSDIKNYMDIPCNCTKPKSKKK